eukprot:scaffold1906_cov403-Prasinococcus_capsulatus_cf.AAC.6
MREPAGALPALVVPQQARISLRPAARCGASKSAWGALWRQKAPRARDTTRAKRHGHSWEGLRQCIPRTTSKCTLLHAHSSLLKRGLRGSRRSSTPREPDRAVDYPARPRLNCSCALARAALPARLGGRVQRAPAQASTALKRESPASPWRATGAATATMDAGPSYWGCSRCPGQQ